MRAACRHRPASKPVGRRRLRSPLVNASTDVVGKKTSNKLPAISPAKDDDYADRICRLVHDAFKTTCIPGIRNALETAPAQTLPPPKAWPVWDEEAIATLTATPQCPGIARPVSLVIAASVPTLLGWYGYYKFSIEEELYEAEIRKPGGRATGFGGYGTLLPFVYSVILSVACRLADHPTASDYFFEVGGAWILATQVNLYVRVNELCKEAFPDESPPLHSWWAVLPPPMDVVVGLRQVHYLARYSAYVRGEQLDEDVVAEEYFPFVASERFTLAEFVREPKRWFAFTKDWDNWW